ncbi:MAG TPA: ribonuclease catalytic domain-containing protein [Candidatus Binataceae bacterium]|nr:ribonuclease catalytic domain-containing protein [Candidatus Binataceae bacterium]
MVSLQKYLGTIVEYLDQGRLKAALVTREQERHFAVADANGHEKLIQRDLVLMHHPGRRADAAGASSVLKAFEQERAALAAELDLELLWGVVQEQGRTFTASELAELFFGTRSNLAASVMFEALLNDSAYFVRRHMDFLPRTPEQMDRIRVQQDRIRARSADYRKTQEQLHTVLTGAPMPPEADAAALIDQLSRYLSNPFTRSREITHMLEHAAPEVQPAEAAFEILERLGARPPVPRFAFIAGLKPGFSEAAMQEAASILPAPRPLTESGFSVTIDDDDTVEVDDALSLGPADGDRIRVRVHIALVADFVPRGGPMDREAAERATTVYLPETTIRMLPDPISCSAASLLAGNDRPVLTTDVTLSEKGELLEASIYPARIPINQRLDYEEVDRILDRTASSGDEVGETVRRLNIAANRLRERRRTAGALLTRRREAKVRVHNGEIDIHILDTSSPARLLVAEMMILSNFVAARYAAENRIPIIYRVQPQSGDDFAAQRPRLSLHPEFHAGIGLEYYAQVSSPIRRYADLVLQRQLLAALSGTGTSAYSEDELLSVLAGAENAEAAGRDLERRAKRYWILRHLERTAGGTPLCAFVTREGASAELIDFAIRGTLHGAPNLPNDMQVLVKISRVDPLRGWLAFDYIGPADRAGVDAGRGA